MQVTIVNAITTAQARDVPKEGPVFAPKPSDKQLTAGQDFRSATATRRMTRAQFDAAVAEKARLQEVRGPALALL